MKRNFRLFIYMNIVVLTATLGTLVNVLADQGAIQQANAESFAEVLEMYLLFVLAFVAFYELGEFFRDERLSPSAHLGTLVVLGAFTASGMLEGMAVYGFLCGVLAVTPVILRTDPIYRYIETLETELDRRLA